MKGNRETPMLDDVLNEFMAGHDSPTADAVEALARRYPQYRRALIDFAAAWAEQRALPPAPPLEAEREKALIDRAMSHVENVAYGQGERTPEQRKASISIASLTGEAKRKGFSAQEFAKACGLDLVLISKLNNRQIRPATIPPRLIGHIGQLLDRAVEAIEEYLARPPNAPAATAFLSRGKPRTPGQQSFADAVRTSSLSKAEKARWLDEVAGLEES